MTQQATTHTTTRLSARPAVDVLARELAEPSLLQSPDMTKKWWPQSLAGGAAGIAMLHVERARADLSTWDAAHAWLKVVTGSEIQAGAPGGLFEGGPAVAFAVNAAADVPGKYAKAIASLDGYVTSLTRRRLRAAHSRLADGELAAFTEYDVIYGLAGIGSYLLRREQLHDLLRDVLSYLVALTRPLRFGGQTVPGWWTRAAPTGQPSPDFLAGRGNFGMAHGISGPLALLALAMRQGVGVAGQVEAIGVICAWLDEWRQEGTNGPWWPEWITYADVRDHQVRRAGPHRPSWCYGTPGLARAQQLAGQAIRDTGRQHLAERALAQCLADEALLAQITDRTICHGTAGVFQTAWWAAKDATTPAIAARLPRLRILLNGTSSGSGDTESTAEGDLIDTAGNLGLLNGAAGIGLALHTATTDAPPSSRWDTCLLIA